MAMTMEELITIMDSVGQNGSSQQMKPCLKNVCLSLDLL